MSIPRLYQQIAIYNVEKNEYGDNSYESETDVTGKINLGTRIVKDARGEDIQEVARLWINSKDYLMTKGQAILYGNIYYLLDDVRQTRNLSGTDFFQFAIATKTNDTSE
jgi:hypothetical protein